MTAWPLVPLGDVTSHRKAFIFINDETLYSRPKVRLGAKGIVLRDKVPGSEIKTKKQQVCQPGDFLVAEIDAKMGGYGIVPDELGGSIVSSHYFLYSVNESYLLRSYLGWYIKTRSFLEQVKAKGSTNYAAIRPKNVLEYTIPLPSLPEQQAIVARLDATAATVERHKTTATNQEAILSQLLNQAFWQIAKEAPYRPMAEVAPLVRRPVVVEPEASYTELGVKSFYRGVFHRRTLLGEEFTWQKLFLIQQGDLVFSNLMAWEQAIAVAKPADDGCVGNHRILTCETNPSIALPDFLWFYFTTTEGFAEIVKASPGSIARNKTLSSVQLPKILVPVPSITQQQAFVALLKQADNIRQRRAVQAEHWAKLMPSLLHEAFSGKLPLKKNTPQLSIVPAIAPSTIAQNTPEFTAYLLAYAYFLHPDRRKKWTYGRVKAQKTLHLCESILAMDLGRQPIKDAAGPNDFQHMLRAEDWARQQQFFEFVPNESGNGYHFVTLANYNEMISTACKVLKPYHQQLQVVLDIIIPMDSQQTEVLATVHAAWNNLLLDGNLKPTDKEIVQEARDNWHNSKLNIDEGDFHQAIKTIRQHDIIPTGKGKRVNAKGEGQQKLTLI